MRRVTECSPAAARRCPSHSMTPLLERVCVRMNRPIRITTTGWPKPDMASRASCGRTLPAQDPKAQVLGEAQGYDHE